MTKSQETWDTLRAENHALLGQVEKLTRVRNVEIALIEDYGKVVAGLTQERDRLILGEEGAKEAFGVLVDKKRALEEEVRQMRRTIDVQQGIIRALQRTQPAMPTNQRNGEWPTLDPYELKSMKYMESGNDLF